MSFVNFLAPFWRLESNLLAFYGRNRDRLKRQEGQKERQGRRGRQMKRRRKDRERKRRTKRRRKGGMKEKVEEKKN